MARRETDGIMLAGCVLLAISVAIVLLADVYATTNGTAANATSRNATDAPNMTDRIVVNMTAPNMTVPNATVSPSAPTAGTANPYIFPLDIPENGPTEREYLYYLVWLERQKVAGLTAQLAALNQTNASAVADLAAAQAKADLLILEAEEREAEARALIAGVNDLIADRNKARADLLVMHQHALQCVDRHAALHHALAPFILNATGPPVPHPDGR